MLALIQQFVINNILVLGAVNILLGAAALLHRAYKSTYGEYSTRAKEELWPRVEAYLKSASTARHMPTMDLRANERDYVYDILLSYAEYYDLDIHEIFDANGFTRERIEKLWTRKNPQLLRELAIIKSPQAEDLLFARLAETNGEEAYRVARTLAVMELSPNNQKRLMKTVIKAAVNVERCIDLFVPLRMPVEVLMEQLYEQESLRGEKILLRTIALADGLDQEWIVDDIRPYLFHSQEVVIPAVMVLAACGTSGAFELLRSEYYNNLSWEVRSAVAKMMSRFDPYHSVPLLKVMTGDESWWVRFNALASLAEQGMPGEEALFELTYESPDPVLADFADHIINPVQPVARQSLHLSERPVWMNEEQHMDDSLFDRHGEIIAKEPAEVKTGQSEYDHGAGDGDEQLEETNAAPDQAGARGVSEPLTSSSLHEEVPDEQLDD